MAAIVYPGDPDASKSFSVTQFQYHTYIYQTGDGYAVPPPKLILHSQFTVKIGVEPGQMLPDIKSDKTK